MIGTPRWLAPVVILMFVGCTQESSGGGNATVELAEVAPAVVTRADIVSVITVDAVVVATPPFAVLSEVRGPVQHAFLKLDSPVTAESQVAFQGEVALMSPVDGYLAERLVPEGVSVHSGVPVVLLRYAGFGAIATVPVSVAYRLYDGPTMARLQITGGPGPIDCRPLPVAATAAGPAPAETFSVEAVGPQMQVLCAIPAEVSVIDGSRGVLGVMTGEAREVLTLPLSAVAGAAGSGAVVKLVDGQPVLTEVSLGITDGIKIEITEGLDEGDQVWPYGPELRPRLPGRQ